mmetsp:Transcript_10797/g.28897  ORF Transcript_10797/g.28897 Transcript_10797/m.28897 type:complete len:285 (-) Transcript_10797:849-1703(-)
MTDLAAFVGSAASSFAGGAVGAKSENVAVAVAPAKRSAAVSMSVYPQTGLVQSRFRARAVVKTAAKRKDKVDEYFAASVTRQYKQMAVPFGEYTTQCAEGAVRGQAEERRNAALSRQFRLKQRSPAAKAHALFENRKQALIAAHNCSAEEKLFVSYPKLAAAYVLGKAEAMRTCSRYVVPDSVAEEYMAAAVDKQMKMRGARGGVYSSSCVEGNQKGQAEQARVHGLAAAFRAAQKSPAQKSGERYAAAKYGRLQFAHGCEHEEQEFNKYPACAAAMRSTAYGY